MSERATPRGEMKIPMNVQGKKGNATLSVIPEGGESKGDSKPKEKAEKPPEPTPTVQASPPKVVRLVVQAEFGSFEEKVDSLEAAKARAEEIMVKGAWQNTGNQMILHGPNVIRRVVVTQ